MLIRWSITLLLLVAWVVPATAEAPSMAVDIVTGTLNGRLFTTYTLDEMTDLLGRPSTVLSPSVDDGIYSGAKLLYPDLGLSVWFRHTKVDSTRSCREFLMYLSRTYDRESQTVFDPFQGIIAQGVTADWKADRVVDELGEFGAHDRFHQDAYDSSVELHETMLALGIVHDPDPRSSFGVMLDLITCVAIDSEGFSTLGFYEYNTRFIERVSLYTGGGVPPEAEVQPD